ncbi:hypothetical protein QN372_01080 [Undibacterium sp. RTI2.1]|uniref:hypothetical protein n=1 Tax=unclassified Undibacterium TaxID=2630295 RepID=UPI002AB415EB|nr:MULTISPECIES: hypothetical protein [unclassified Undibacterium]MDY7537730.1 hypothetical protein [Undibacterium sp. 5I1]MEB0029331.1 hypothetical protein [Undibacterium sp. RTI2.1]MEB0115639.1 hypothetical protein [Undibacterium sp. RTI2.2]MEB0230222.1 hypothetical protein [Undibacterium sp. 10I3]MEB0256467.1 hypothetical protein [Undibacterium sp. 5I1]
MPNKDVAVPLALVLSYEKFFSAIILFVMVTNIRTFHQEINMFVLFLPSFKFEKKLEQSKRFILLNFRLITKLPTIKYADKINILATVFMYHPIIHWRIRAFNKIKMGVYKKT